MLFDQVLLESNELSISFLNMFQIPYLGDKIYLDQDPLSTFVPVQDWSCDDTQQT